jgi:hypothetical protein
MTLFVGIGITLGATGTCPTFPLQAHPADLAAQLKLCATRPIAVVLGEPPNVNLRDVFDLGQDCPK